MDVDMTGAFAGVWVDIVANAADRGAEELRESVQEVFDTQGGEGTPWRPNEPDTVSWKGHDTIMGGRTGTMVRAATEKLEVRGEGLVELTGTRLRRGGRAPPFGGGASSLGFGGISRTDASTSRFVGVFDQSPHPTSRGLTVAEMFALHEFGDRDGHIPARPWLSRAADLAAERTLDVTANELAIAVTAYSQYIGTLVAQKHFSLMGNLSPKSRQFAEASRLANRALPMSTARQLKFITKDFQDPVSGAARQQTFRSILRQTRMGSGRPPTMRMSPPGRTGYRLR